MENIKYKKRFGQNFLYDQNILEKIYKSITPTEKDIIIEIGPGSGNLTKWLKKYNSNIVAYEIDESLKPKLELLENETTQVIYDDFLNRDLEKDLSNYNYDNLYVIANIPYYITTPIIKKIIDDNIKPKSIILMVQKEVAERLSSKPCSKNYGYITVFLNYYFNINILFNVNKKSFYPIPKVDSAIIKLDPKLNEKIDINKFDNFIKSAFLQKRKTLKNNLKNYDLIKIKNILETHNYSLNNRAEEIPIEIYIEIVKSI